MLGFPGIGVTLAYLLVIAVTVLCMVYGIVNWNKGGNVPEKEWEQEKKWNQKEIEIEETVEGGGK